MDDCNLYITDKFVVSKTYRPIYSIKDDNIIISKAKVLTEFNNKQHGIAYLKNLQSIYVLFVTNYDNNVVYQFSNVSYEFVKDFERLCNRANKGEPGYKCMKFDIIKPLVSGDIK